MSVLHKMYVFVIFSLCQNIDPPLSKISEDDHELLMPYR